MKQLILAGMLALSFSAMATNNGNNGNNNGPTFGGNTSSTAIGVGVGIGQGGDASSKASATGGNAVAVGGSVNSNVKNDVDNTNVNSVSNKNNNVSTSSNSNVSSNNSGASVNVEASDYGDLAPPVYAPSLTTGICLGSVSGGLSTGGFGFSGGSTTVDEECQVRHNSIRLQQLGMDQASVLIMCQVPSSKLALEQSGFLCPIVDKEQKQPKKNVGTGPVWEK